MIRELDDSVRYAETLLVGWASVTISCALFVSCLCSHINYIVSFVVNDEIVSSTTRNEKKKKKKFRGVYTTSAEVAQSCGFRWAFWPSIGVFSITMICLHHSWFGLQRSTSIAQDLQRPCSRPHTEKPSTMHGLLSTNEHPNVRISESCGNRVFIFSGEFV